MKGQEIFQQIVNSDGLVLIVGDGPAQFDIVNEWSDENGILLFLDGTGGDIAISRDELNDAKVDDNGVMSITDTDGDSHEIKLLKVTPFEKPEQTGGDDEK